MSERLGNVKTGQVLGGDTKERLVVIDAMRGWAALAVVLFHFQFGLQTLSNPAVPKLLAVSVWPLLSFGNFGVWLFFVISGFCIHLRWAKARADGRTAEVRFVEFWRRRVRRLYPPYLVALLAYLIVVLVNNNIKDVGLLQRSLVLHLVMLQNIDPSTLNTFNSVFWTLAIEEQLYLAYFVLLSLRVRFGWNLTLACCLLARLGWFGLALLAHRVAGVEILVTQEAAAQWFIWALGALAVERALGLVRLPAWSSNGYVATAILLAAGTAVHFDRLADPFGWPHKIAWVILEPGWGFGFFIALNSLIKRERAWRSRAVIPVFIRYSALVGLFSYSLYLVHELVLSHLWRWFGSTSNRFVEGALIFLPLCIAFSFVFFWLFERPFLNRPVPLRLEN